VRVDAGVHHLLAPQVAVVLLEESLEAGGGFGVPACACQPVLGAGQRSDIAQAGDGGSRPRAVAVGGGVGWFAWPAGFPEVADDFVDDVEGFIERVKARCNGGERFHPCQGDSS